MYDSFNHRRNGNVDEVMEKLKHLFPKFKKQVIGIERIKKGQYQLKRNFGFKNDRGI